MSAFIRDGRFLLLSATNRGRYAILHELAGADGTLPDVFAIAGALGVRPSEVDKTMAALEKVGLVVRDTMRLTSPRTVSTERVRRHRAMKRDETLRNVTKRFTPFHPVSPDPDPEIPPQTPLGKKQDKPESKSLSIPPTPHESEKASESDGDLTPYPETRAALSGFPAIPTQAQLLALTGHLRKRGDAPVAAFVRSVTERHARDPSRIYSPVGFLLNELKTLREPPVTVKKPANPDLYVGKNDGGERELTEAERKFERWRRASEWVNRHGKDAAMFDAAFAKRRDFAVPMTFDEWRTLDGERPWEREAN